MKIKRTSNNQLSTANAQRTWLGCGLLLVMVGGCSPDYKNPYEYNVDKWTKTPTNLLLYTEVATIGLGKGEGNPSAVAVDSSNSVYVAKGVEILFFDRDGKRLGSFATSNRILCLAVDSDGLIYAGMVEHVEVFSRTGERKAQWGSLGEKAFLTSIASSSNDVFVADFGNKTVWRFNKSGALLGRIGKSSQKEGEPFFLLPSPYFDVAFAPGGELWIANPGKQIVGNYSHDGVQKSVLGKASMEFDGFSGCCNPSHIAIGPDGSFVTSEKGLPRVKIYRADGAFEGFVAGTEQFDPDTVGLDLAVDLNGRVIVLYPKHQIVRIFGRRNHGN